MQVYKIQWECANCGHKNSFRSGINEDDGWPNKFDDLECANDECRQEQDVAFRDCVVELVEGSEEY